MLQIELFNLAYYSFVSQPSLPMISQIILKFNIHSVKFIVEYVYQSIINHLIQGNLPSKDPTHPAALFAPCSNLSLCSDHSPTYRPCIDSGLVRDKAGCKYFVTFYNSVPNLRHNVYILYI